MEQAIASVAQAFDGTGQAPEQAALANLYERMASLPPQLQMFMRGCPPALEAKRDRINCRGDLAVFLVDPTADANRGITTHRSR